MQCAARSGTAKTHAAPFSVTSCDPPAFPAGTTAYFGRKMAGTARWVVVEGDPATPADEADGAITASLTDVRGGSVVGSDYDPNPTRTDVRLVIKQRMSDLLNGASQSDPGTASDVDFSVPVTCAATADASTGASCTVNTTADAISPGAVKEGKQTVVSMFRVRLNDSGAVGVRGNTDDRNFAQQGVFYP
jgi:hypothetical protein